MENANLGVKLSLNNINDYLGTSQICVKPLPGRKSGTDPRGARIEVGEGTGIYYEIDQNGRSKELQAVAINLDDCLACSGCVTSTEAVLVASQTHKQVLDTLGTIKNNGGINRTSNLNDDSPRIAIATVSPQTVASFSAKYSVSPQESFHRIQWLLRSMGVSQVFDSSFGRGFSLLECAKDFVERYRRMKDEPSDKRCLPLFTSSCPGWICYAEKAHSELLPFITTSKSPQQVLGSFVKDFVPSIYSISRKSVYHFSVMPCYDKKLESSRSDFKFDGLSDVDCVITSAELELMFQEGGFDFGNFVEHDSPQDVIGSVEFRKVISGISKCTHPISFLLKPEGSSSGGYQSFVMRYAARELFNIELDPESVEHGSYNVTVRELSSPNCKEYTLVDSTSREVLLRFYRVYGFKNMQSVIRAVKKLSSQGNNCSRMMNMIPISNSTSRRPRASAFTHDFHFVEIMACPSGCINGAGQLKNKFADSKVLFDAQKSLTDSAEIAYQSIEKNSGYLSPDKDDFFLSLYDVWLRSSEGERSKIKDMLHTEYHAVEKINIGVSW